MMASLTLKFRCGHLQTKSDKTAKRWLFGKVFRAPAADVNRQFSVERVCDDCQRVGRLPVDDDFFPREGSPAFAAPTPKVPQAPIQCEQQPLPQDENFFPTEDLNPAFAAPVPQVPAQAASMRFSKETVEAEADIADQLGGGTLSDAQAELSLVLELGDLAQRAGAWKSEFDSARRVSQTSIPTRQPLTNITFSSSTGYASLVFDHREINVVNSWGAGHVKIRRFEEWLEGLPEDTEGYEEAVDREVIGLGITGMNIDREVPFVTNDQDCWSERANSGHSGAVEEAENPFAGFSDFGSNYASEDQDVLSESLYSSEELDPTIPEAVQACQREPLTESTDRSSVGEPRGLEPIQEEDEESFSEANSVHSSQISEAQSLLPRSGAISRFQHYRDDNSDSNAESNEGQAEQNDGLWRPLFPSMATAIITCIPWRQPSTTIWNFRRHEDDESVSEHGEPVFEEDVVFPEGTTLWTAPDISSWDADSDSDDSHESDDAPDSDDGSSHPGAGKSPPSEGSDGSCPPSHEDSPSSESSSPNNPSALPNDQGPPPSDEVANYLAHAEKYLASDETEQEVSEKETTADKIIDSYLDLNAAMVSDPPARPPTKEEIRILLDPSLCFDIDPQPTFPLRVASISFSPATYIQDSCGRFRPRYPSPLRVEWMLQEAPPEGWV